MGGLENPIAKAIYVYSVNDTLVFTTLKSGSTFLSDNLYGGFRPRFLYNYITNSLSYHEITADISGLETISKLEQQNIINNIIEEYNNIINGTSDKNISFIIRNPYKRLISSMTEDTISKNDYFTKSNGKRYTDINRLFVENNLDEIELEFEPQGDKFQWWPTKKYLVNLAKNGKSFSNEYLEYRLFFLYLVDSWYENQIGEGLDIESHLVDSWESFIYGMITRDNIPLNKIKIYDVDESNLYSLVRDIESPQKPANASIKSYKSSFHAEIHRSKYQPYLDRFIEIDMWFYDIIRFKFGIN